MVSLVDTEKSFLGRPRILINTFKKNTLRPTQLRLLHNIKQLFYCHLTIINIVLVL